MPIVQNVMDFIYELVQLIKFSPNCKRLYVFDSLRKNVVVSGGESTPRLRHLWHTSINSILLNYEILLTILEEVQKGHDEYAGKASGLNARMELFDMYNGLKLANLFFFLLLSSFQPTYKLRILPFRKELVVWSY